MSLKKNSIYTHMAKKNTGLAIFTKLLVQKAPGS